MNMKGRNRLIAVFLAALAASALFACGAAEDDRKLYEGGATTAATAVGMDVCATCHLGMVEEWLATPHANLNPNNTSDLSYVGSPTVAEITGPPVCTKNCHNLNTESANLIPNVTGPVGGRPVVGCEACHGGGSNHNGGGPIGPAKAAGNLTAALTTTLTTIDVTAPNNTFTRIAGNFVTDGFVPGITITVSGYTNAANNGTFSVLRVTATTIVITASTLVVEAGTGDELIISNPVTAVSAQFNTCTDCHQLSANGINKATAAHDAGGSDTVAPGIASTNASITDTHFATAGVFTGANSANTVDITGYAMNYSSETVCGDCHNPHRNIDINREWAQSAHGGDWTLAGAWAHYDWSAANRSTCQRCKTTTGFSAYADALRTGNSARAADIRAGVNPPLSPVLGFKPETLKCNGCHTDNRGSLRNPGPITGYYDIVISGTTRSRFSYSFLDIKESNICMACHTGRETGESIKLLNDQGLSGVDFSNLGFGNVNSHYLTAGATVFRVSGYEYPNRNYDDLTGYRHKNIGTSAEPGTGARGPCIGCHMSRPSGNGDHLFLPVSRNATTGVVTGIASEVCMVCHGPSPTLIFDLVSHQESLYAGALEALKYQLETLNAYHGAWTWTAAYPYFANMIWTSTGDPDATGNTTGKHNIGAAFNFNLLEHEGGGYVHNRMYVKRLIYDSIDWLDNNKLDYSTGAWLDSLAGPPVWQPEAKEFLLPNGVRWVGTYPAGYGVAAERP